MELNKTFLECAQRANCYGKYKLRVFNNKKSMRALHKVTIQYEPNEFPYLV